jgi:hypothetical protein
MKAITLASYSEEVGRGFRTKAARGSASAFFWLIVAFLRSEDETEIRAGEGTDDAYPSVPRLPNGTRNRKTKPIIAAGAQ